MEHKENASHEVSWLSAVTATGFIVLSAACGSTAPTQQLVDARRAYDDARASEAAQYTPDKLLTAEQALARAEAAHDDDSGSPHEAHLAYIASRKAHIAMAHGKIAAAKQAEDKALALYQQRLENVATTSQSKLAGAEQQLEGERARRAEAEKRAAAALASLAEVAKVKEETRGMVITLPGGVLFPSGGRELSASARQALDQVATALTEQPTDAKILIEGHTDDRGSDSTNLELSRSRAEAVRAYLVQRGLAAQRIEAVGKGESTPIAGNDTAEGRATNRRVEIVVNTSQPTAATPPSMGGAGQMPPTTPSSPTATSGQ
jgi:outer membrane protein OmpA-like peptidoglycan-associated protein